MSRISHLLSRMQPRGTPGVLALALVLCGWVCQATAAVTASLEPRQILLGDQATFSLSFSGELPASAPAFPNVPGLQVFGPNQSQSVNIVNGRMTSTAIFSYGLRAQRTGEFEIPSITVTVGNERVTTERFKLVVVQPGSSWPPGAAEPLVMLKLEPPQKEVYVGETITVEMKLHLHGSIRNLAGFQFASISAEGFNVGKHQDGPQSRAQIGNATYTVIPIYIALTPIKADNLTVGPITAQMVIDLPSARRQRDIMDPWALLERNDRHNATVATEPTTIVSRTLPRDNAPPGFAGAIGRYQLAFSASPTNIAAGDPITVKVQISGRGALDGLALPEQPGWKEFRVYPATSKIETTDALGIEGVKSFEQVIVPQNTEIASLPPFLFSYFDPDKRQFQTLKSEAIPLTVRPSGFTPPPSIAGAKTEAPAAEADILPIRQRPGTLIAQSAPLIARPEFLAMQSVPVLALIAAWIWRRRGESLANNPRLRRQRQVAQTVREGLADLRRLATENNSDAFFATVFRLLQEQLGERLDMPASSITESVIEERLRPRGVPDQTLAGLHELFHACNVARYAPIKSSQELAAFVPRVETALRQLQEVKS